MEVHGTSLRDQDANLVQVLQRLQEYNLTLNDDKCHFQAQEIYFIGYQLSSQGVKPLHSGSEATLGHSCPPAWDWQIIIFGSYPPMSQLPLHCKLCLRKTRHGIGHLALKIQLDIE